MAQQAEGARAMLSSPHMLISDPGTDGEAANGMRPGYQPFVHDSTGRMAMVPDPATGLALRLHFDPGPAQKAAEDDFTAKRRAYFDNHDIAGRPMPMDAGR